jgi:hypothetical protein
MYPIGDPSEITGIKVLFIPPNTTSELQLHVSAFCEVILRLTAIRFLIT